MYKINTNYQKLPGSYLFSNIAKKVSAFTEAHPDADIILSLIHILLFFVLTALLAALRVLGGVHYVRDVAAGAAMGVLCGLLGFFIL